ncbi:hypothetical protein Mal4_39700 [Maioricimonas rarisocia]|uniref:SMODS and SLOG-associating 2TM effector domain-containing protein n=1 Tax=Maioricimonas rarisocia TaxID=2528026 RepID=A0A517ZAV8_9PLAN|nr:hypothetical protein [Maioricimonas rarisocia]QDU39624.1 hypothetical protein Mal4_39700 [Maioricimonas rarisocia]
MSRDFASPESFAYSLRIGVTGHRNLSDAAGVAEAVERLQERIENTLRPQTRTPLNRVVISPLAKGADRIVAETVLKRERSSLEVLSPFTLAEYRRDFEEPDDREEFEILLDRADVVRCVTTDSPPQDASDDEQSDWRNRGYLQVGRAVVDACEMLIVVWDGKEARGTGGTADIVGYALRQRRTVIWVNANTPSSEPQLILRWQPGEEPETDALPSTAKQLSLGYHQLDAYNRDASVGRDVLSSATISEQEALRARASDAGLPADSIRHVIDVLVPHFVRADRLAVHYRNNYVRAMTGLFLLSALAVSVVVGQVLFFPELLWIILLEILAMGTAVGLWMWCRRGAWHEKWIHDRYLAERLRMAMFSLLLDQADAALTSAASQALSFYSGPRHWLLSTVRSVVEAARSVPHKAAGFEATRRFVVEAWLDDQRRYHVRNADRTHKAARRGHRVGTVLFLVTLVMAVLHFLGVGHGEHDHAASGVSRLDAWITFFAIVLPTWGAAIHAITTQLELERIAARSERMAMLLSLVVERAREAESLDALREVVAEGQRVMGTENHEWWILLSFRQPVLPT